MLDSLFFGALMLGSLGIILWLVDGWHNALERRLRALETKLDDLGDEVRLIRR